VAKVSEKARERRGAELRPSGDGDADGSPTGLAPRVRRRVGRFDGDEAVAHIDRRAEKYVSQENYPMAQAGRAAG
jgi:hypothetical protein